MNRDDRAVAADPGLYGSIPHAVTGDHANTLGHHGEARLLSAKDGEPSTDGKTYRLRVDHPQDGAGTQSETLLWLVFSRVVLPLTILIGSGLLIHKARVWLKPRVDTAMVVQDIRTGGEARWRAVAQIGAILDDDRYPEIRTNPELAAAVSEAFRDELRVPLRDQNDLSVVSRKYLCFVLHQFDHQSVVPALCEGAVWWGTSVPHPGSPVRRAAVEGLYEMAERLGPQILRTTPEVMPALCTAASDPIDPVRAAAALTLGMHGGPEACATLESLLDDPAPNVRYSAAIGLGMAGSPKGLPVLNQLFHCAEVERLAATGNTESIAASRTCRLVFLGLCSVESLLDGHPGTSVDVVRPAVYHFCQSRVPRHVKAVAIRVQHKMSR
jgi:hypothetical protein